MALLLAAGSYSCSSSQPLQPLARHPSSRHSAGSPRTPLWTIREGWRWERPVRTVDLTEWRAERVDETGESVLTRAHGVSAEVKTRELTSEADATSTLGSLGTLGTSDAPLTGLAIPLSTDAEEALNSQVLRFVSQAPERPDTQVTELCDHWIEVASGSGRRAICFEAESTPLAETAERISVRRLLQQTRDAFHGP